jgi:hypothetical protein
MLRVRFPPSHPDTVQRKYKNALWSTKKTKEKKHLLKEKRAKGSSTLKHKKGKGSLVKKKHHG